MHFPDSLKVRQNYPRFDNKSLIFDAYRRKDEAVGTIDRPFIFSLITDSCFIFLMGGCEINVAGEKTG
jgi:hypothetical protein